MPSRRASLSLLLCLGQAAGLREREREARVQAPLFRERCDGGFEVPDRPHRAVRS